jgi:hypothetical protein
VENTIKYYKKLNAELGNPFFVEKFGYTGFQMMCANLTYIYAISLTENIDRGVLKQVKATLKKEHVTFNACPIPLQYSKFKLKLLFLISYIKRWLKASILKYSF